MKEAQDAALDAHAAVDAAGGAKGFWKTLERAGVLGGDKQREVVAGPPPVFVAGNVERTIIAQRTARDGSGRYVETKADGTLEAFEVVVIVESHARQAYEGPNTHRASRRLVTESRGPIAAESVRAWVRSSPRREAAAVASANPPAKPRSPGVPRHLVDRGARGPRRKGGARGRG